MIGQLFTQDFLSAGIRETPVWQFVTDAELDEFVGRLKTNYAQFKADSNLNEPVTENEIIVRVLSTLGWSNILTQQVASKSRREDVPDMLPFPHAAAKAAALREELCRMTHAVSYILDTVRLGCSYGLSVFKADFTGVALGQFRGSPLSTC